MKKKVYEIFEKQVEEWKDIIAEPIPQKELDESETLLTIKLPQDYREFICKYGGAVISGVSIFGLRKPLLMPDYPYSFVEQSLIFRRELPENFSNIVVISVDDSGNPMGFLPPNKTIFTYDFDFGGEYTLASNFEDYLINILKIK